jgi:hypothetical protein
VTTSKDGRSRIVLGNARSYYLMDWAEGGKPSEGVGGGETSTDAAVPLVVDPNGRSAIMMGGAGHDATVVSATCGRREEARP